MWNRALSRDGPQSAPLAYSAGDYVTQALLERLHVPQAENARFRLLHNRGNANRKPAEDAEDRSTRLPPSFNSSTR